MLMRIGFVAGVTSAVVGMPVWQANMVHAAAPEPEQKKKIRPSELPIYGDPEPPELEVLPEWDTTFHQKVSDARKWTWSYLDSVQDSTNRVKDKFETAKAHTAGTLSYIQDDSSLVARVAIITVSGLGGIVAGYKGGAIRKSFYAATAMAAASSVCYPKQAIVVYREVYREGSRLAKDFASTTYHDLLDNPEEKKAKKRSSPAPKATEKPATINPNAPKMDFGMSKPEDKDMYTTRDS